MDTTKEYIAMCKAAEEIQEHFSDIDNRIGRPVYFYQYAEKGPRWEAYERIGIEYDEDFASENTKHVWLPSQDQLQALYKDQNITHLTYEFYRFCFGPQFARAIAKVRAMQYSVKFKSLEQLWLGFIMQEEYGKLWDGEKWMCQKNILL